MKNISPRRFVMMVGGIVTMGLAIALFNLTRFGTDPYTAFTMALAGQVGIPFPVVSLLLNCAVFAVMLLWGRRRIGAGTFVNWAGVGPLTTLFSDLIGAMWAVPRAVLPRLVLMLAALALLGLAVSLYQTADLGNSPYDSTSLILAEKLPVPYFWCRIFTDAVCTAGAFAMGGVVGVGTLLSALGTGPFVAFFDVHVSRRLLDAE